MFSEETEKYSGQWIKIKKPNIDKNKGTSKNYHFDNLRIRGKHA